MDACRPSERFQSALTVCQCDQQGRLGKREATYPQRAHCLALLAAAQSVNTGAIAQQYAHQPQQIPIKIDEARADAVRPVQRAYQREAE